MIETQPRGRSVADPRSRAQNDRGIWLIIIAVLVSTGLARAQRLSDLDLDDLIEEEEIVAVDSLRRRGISRASATVTVISGDRARASGARGVGREPGGRHQDPRACRWEAGLDAGVDRHPLHKGNSIVTGR